MHDTPDPQHDPDPQHTPDATDLTDPGAPGFSGPARRGLGAYAGWIVAALLVAAAWGGAVMLRGDTTPVHLDGWAAGLDAGMAEAKQQDRPMLVMFTADWCGPCQALKKDVIQTPAARSAIADGFVPVVIDLTDQSADNPDTAAAQRYGVRGIPMLILTDAAGDVLPGTVPYPNRTYPRTPEGFVGWLGSANRAAAR